MLVRIFAAIATIVDSVLSTFVEGLNLTEPEGHELAGALSQILRLGAGLWAGMLEALANTL